MSEYTKESRNITDSIPEKETVAALPDQVRWHKFGSIVE